MRPSRKTLDDDERAGLVLAAALILSSLAALPCSGEGQRVDPALVHARACVGELGWRAPDDACAAIVEVHQRRAALSGLRPESVAARYSAALRRPRRAWVPQLAPGPTPPMAWPSGPSWQRHEPRLRELVEVARATLAGERPVACPDAVHYGSVRLDPVPAGHVEVCRWRAGRHEQAFYARESAIEGGAE